MCFDRSCAKGFFHDVCHFDGMMVVSGEVAFKHIALSGYGRFARLCEKREFSAMAAAGMKQHKRGSRGRVTAEVDHCRGA